MCFWTFRSPGYTQDCWAPYHTRFVLSDVDPKLSTGSPRAVPPSEALIGHSLPCLQSLQLPFEFAVLISVFRAPMLNSVRMLVVTHSAQPERTSGAIHPTMDCSGHGTFTAGLVTCCAALRSLSSARRRAVTQRGTHVVDCDHVANALVRVETRECVSPHGLW